ncbi:BglG family transcription antiterminator [Clostridium ganghwense]|uniref:BglG family transcription antiterminator n=1 Tax=Clostridium ganghwense TaxID=312089 RepID=A0ABT4CM90_9CLOT|nr:BglG family transcription antiterminator [Clostridium ganghwense]MCY6369356.1 BglG family transcription antiterminator [Clostridium ganghwense]
MINERELKIINFLIDKDHYITGEEISSFIGISSKTLRVDVKNINQKLKAINTEIACVKGRGYILDTLDKNAFNRELVKLYEEKVNNKNFIPTTANGRTAYIIKRLLILELKENKGITHSELCDELYISLTTLKSDLITVKKKLHKFNIQILKDGLRGIALKGSEDDLRSCISYFIFRWDENDIVDLENVQAIFNKDKAKQIEEILIKSINKNGITITDMSFYNLLIHILIAIKRIENENTVQVVEFIDELKNTFEFQVAKNIANSIFEVTQTELPKEEIYYITQHLYTRKIIDNAREQQEIDVQDEYNVLVKEILEEIEEAIGIDFKNDKVLIWSLATHLKSSINRIKFDMHITNDMLQEIKKTYSFAYKIASISGNYLEKKIGKEINEDEIGFICLHFAASLQRLKGEKGKNKLRTLIICASGLGTSMILSAKIKSDVNNKIEIVKVLPLNELTSVNKESYDLIISTIKIDANAYGVQDKKVIYVSPILKPKDMCYIKDFVEESSDEFLLRFLEFTEEELFFVDKDFKTKEEILNFMLEEMVSKEYLNEEDKAYFFKRENISSTEIGNLIAIPHAIDINPEISKVCILVNKKPIQWEEENVRLVILMSIEKELYLEFGEILENLYTQFSDEEKVIKLVNSRNYKEFIKLLR